MKLLPCDAPRRSAINPHLTRIWSQFGRGSRPRAGGTARVHAPRKEPRPRGGTSATPPPSELPRPAALFQVQMHFFFFFLIHFASGHLRADLPRPSPAGSPFCQIDRSTLQVTSASPPAPGDCRRPTGDSSARPGEMCVVPCLPLGSPQPSQVSVFSSRKKN